MVRIFTNVLVFLSLAGTSYAIYLAVDNTESVVHKNFQQAVNEGTEGFKLFLASFQVWQIVVHVYSRARPSVLMVLG